MSLAITIVSKNLAGQRREVVADITFDSSYPNTGGTVGEPLTAAQLGLKAIETMTVAETAQGYLFTYDRAHAVLHAFYVDNNAGSDSALIEVPDGTDLSLATCRVTASGR